MLCILLLLSAVLSNEQVCSAANEWCTAELNSKEAKEAQTKQIPQDTSFSVEFTNQGSKTADIYWKAGSRSDFIASVKPSEGIAMKTYHGHTFFAAPKDYRSPKLVTWTIHIDKKIYAVEEEMFKRVGSGGCMDRTDNCDLIVQHEFGCENGWTIVNCARTCNETNKFRDYCQLRDPKFRCDPKFLNLTMKNALPNGRIQENVNRIFSEAEFQVLEPKLVHDEFPLIQFDNFLSKKECNALFDTTADLERSTDHGEKNEFGEAKRVISSGRTSLNAWCRHECMNHPLVKNIIARIEKVTNVPKENFESPQVLQYTKGQFYQNHYDRSMINADGEVDGGRIYTFFLYCSDVEEGGETSFPNIGIKVKPKLGRAVLWPSVLDLDVKKLDRRSFHSGLPVKKGKKLASNVWIHQRNFEKPNDWGCTGSFD